MTTAPENHRDHAENPERGSDGYKIGRGRPPKHTQWKPGESGNRSGRRKGDRSCRDYLKQELDALISVRENGKTITLTRRKAFVKAVVNGAIQGDRQDEKILMMFEKPEGDAHQSGGLEIIDVDSEDEIPG